MRYVVKFLVVDNPDVEVINGIYESFDDAERVVYALVKQEDGDADSAWIEVEDNPKLHTDAVFHEPPDPGPGSFDELRDDVNEVKDDLSEFKHDVGELDRDLARFESEGGAVKKSKKK